MSLQASTRSIVIGVRELEELQRKVEAASEADTFEMLDAIGQQQEDSARRRIAQTKTSPEGKRWPSWSREYAKTRHANHSLLRNEGHLADSMTHVVVGKDAVDIGSNLVYAARHLYGDVSIGPIRGTGGRIPARPYLDTEPGFADSRDREEIRDITREFLKGILT